MSPQQYNNVNLLLELHYLQCYQNKTWSYFSFKMYPYKSFVSTQSHFLLFWEGLFCSRLAGWMCLLISGFTCFIYCFSWNLQMQKNNFLFFNIDCIKEFACSQVNDYCSFFNFLDFIYVHFLLSLYIRLIKNKSTWICGFPKRLVFALIWGSCKIDNLDDDIQWQSGYLMQ